MGNLEKTYGHEVAHKSGQVNLLQNKPMLFILLNNNTWTAFAFLMNIKLVGYKYAKELVCHSSKAFIQMNLQPKYRHNNKNNSVVVYVYEQDIK